MGNLMGKKKGDPSGRRKASDTETKEQQNNQVPVVQDPTLLVPLDPVIFQHSIQGIRPRNEDAMKINRRIGKLSTFQMYAIYDGHNGTECSTYCYANLDRIVAKKLSKLRERKDAKYSWDELSYTLVSSLVQIDEDYAKTAKDGGCTALVALFDRVHRQMVIASLGDSRAVMGRRNGRALALTVDHKPTDESERRRIEAAGHVVVDNRVDDILACSRAVGDQQLKTKDAHLSADMKAISCYPYVRRIRLLEGLSDLQHETLIGVETAEAREFGELTSAALLQEHADRKGTQFKYPLEDHECPDVLSVQDKGPFSHFIVFACDGLYDVASNKEIVSWVNKQLQLRQKQRDAMLHAALIDAGLVEEEKTDITLEFTPLSTLAKDLCDYALEKNSTDNVSVVIVLLSKAPTKPTDEEKAAHVAAFEKERFRSQKVYSIKKK